VKGNVYQWKNNTFRFSYMWETILEQFNEEVHKLEKGERNLTIKSLAGPLKNFTNKFFQCPRMLGWNDFELFKLN
jgi:hypothetical protein